jgi:hypothetical protein
MCVSNMKEIFALQKHKWKVKLWQEVHKASGVACKQLAVCWNNLIKMQIPVYTILSVLSGVASGLRVKSEKCCKK